MNRTVALNAREWEKITEVTNDGRSYVHRGDGGFARMPHTINLAVNNSCFMRCHMCDVGAAVRSGELTDDMLFFNARHTGGGKDGMLPIETIRALMDDVAPYKPIIRANFLEPLVRDDIVDMADYARSLDLPFYIQTNGYLLPKRAEGLVAAGTRCIRVSVDGPPEIHNQIRGLKDAWANAIEGVAMLIEWKKTHNRDYPLIGLSYTFSDYNYDKAVEFYEELVRLGLAEDVYVAFNQMKYNTQDEADSHNARCHTLLPLTESSLKWVKLEAIDPDILCDQLDELDRRFPSDRFKWHVNSRLTREETRQWYDGKTFLHPGAVCYETWTAAQIRFDGEVGINGRCIAPNFGNIREGRFTDIWNSAAAQAFRRTILQDPLIPACNRCNRSFRRHTGEDKCGS
jgi:MoaA/NifB/PqqE/SkfB family radical SAM enzyme